MLSYLGHIQWSYTMWSYLGHTQWSHAVLSYLGHTQWSLAVLSYLGHTQRSLTVLSYLSHTKRSLAVFSSTTSHTWHTSLVRGFVLAFTLILQLFCPPTHLSKIFVSKIYQVSDHILSPWFGLLIFVTWDDGSLLISSIHLLFLYFPQSIHSSI